MDLRAIISSTSKVKLDVRRRGLRWQEGPRKLRSWSQLLNSPSWRPCLDWGCYRRTSPRTSQPLFVNCKSNTIFFFTLWLAGFLAGLPICPYSPFSRRPGLGEQWSGSWGANQGSFCTPDMGIRLALASLASAAFNLHTPSRGPLTIPPPHTHTEGF